MKTHVVDASAVIAFLANEAGADAAREYCKGALMSAVNLTEVLQDASRRNTLEIAHAILHHIQIQIVPYDSHSARATAELHRVTQGKNVSLADRACLALGKSKGLPVVTGDQAWQQLDIGVELIMFRPS